MKAAGDIPILFLFLVNCYVNCQNFDYNNVIDYENDNFTLTVVFQVQATYNSITGDVCANGVTNDTANLLCQNIFHDPSSNLQATGFLTTDYSTFVFNSVAYSVDCSSGIDTCPGTQVSNCDSYGGLLAVKCVIRGFNGAPSGVTVPPPTLHSSDTISNRFSCSGALSVILFVLVIV
ncbi:PREDICTED: uncharacterized protein LOC109587499 isoform X2 [Amphimedon queenslandica]|uniref:SRCR domain-containing protein n=1 Tax=Amphimedon queenslandica TaxID=400682 RepID=A0AAN0JQI1_AMPQE|nr:PREDICTED: uncharacterized protein LOC109587499 isoform X2 [Amphimedon queenslandica]XP_019859300.1 PREDICTED: uncharacterized protein LOC109587499 isoform X2 [Amphimedon queenslandica]XP_019859301.1 PREDICTED: uncharacterized protein LOC109587499 isoform X2 [Amphimedon queenslandica]XP_019859302.1 PREDICTED: uncharacterized protein LOC109587499 isoform X2 [Amphimedon queenslandica]|eukprot:XP_019859299.1 PREDICTED: uncharacterized protein LOC109587499 isoform X2 [Amphimedon queenslandica]